MNASIHKVTDPKQNRATWVVQADNGSQHEFTRKKDAQRFINRDCVCTDHNETPTFKCTNCFGRRIMEADSDRRS